MGCCDYGNYPLEGEHGLINILQSSNSTSDLVNTLNAAASSHSGNFFCRIIDILCVLTSFLGVSLCLTDFWADALQLEKKVIKISLLQPLLFAY